MPTERRETNKWERINKQLNEAEAAIKRAESREEKRQKAAEQAVKNYDSRRNMDAEFLSNFNINTLAF